MIYSTISAISTPYGKGGVAMIRISGDDAISIAQKMFKSKSRKPLSQISAGQIVYGDIISENEIIDDGMAAIFRAPHSYTGEDTVEITCHGGILISRTVLEASFACGAVPAAAGEFTKRAFINGKLSLSQAEAVINLIDAETTDKLKLAHSHQQGVFSREINTIYENLLALVSNAYVYADYPDEDLTDITVPEMLERLSETQSRLKSLISTYKTGKAINQGIYTAIIGKPNTGKSSLLNRLLEKERAIVSQYAGTTRDSIEETAVIGKIMLRLADTAGIHDCADEIEKMGIERSIEAIKNAELILAVFDGSASLDSEDNEVIETLKQYNTPKIAVINKSDVSSVLTLPPVFDAVIGISAKNGDGIDELKTTIENMFAQGTIDYNNTAIVANSRQKASLDITLECVSRAMNALADGMTQDIAGMDIEQALSALAETDGRAVTQDIVDSIFHKFCVGK